MRIPLLAMVLGSVLTLAHLPVAQAQTLINFDNVADGTLINGAYSALGVTFDCHLGSDTTLNECSHTNSTGYGGDVYARTPTAFSVSATCNPGWIPFPARANTLPNGISINPLSPCPGNATFFNEQNGYVVARFPTPVASISIFANALFPPEHLGTTGNMPYMNAYDPSGKFLKTVSYSASPISDSLGWVQMTITPAMVNNTPIGFAVFSSSFAGGFHVWGEFDDFSFTSPAATVPNVVRMTLSNAGASITTAKLTVGAVSYSTSTTVPPGEVISQNPVAGTVVSQGTAVNLVVSRATTATTLVSSLNPSTYGTAVTFKATVTSSVGVPTGTVTFKNGATILGSGTLSGGIVSLTTSTVPAGTNTITAVYSGSSDFSGSTSTLTQAVNKAGTSTTVSASVNPSSFNQSVTFTAKVTDATSGTPSGTVTFKDGATVLGVGALNASGIATLATTSLSVGAHSITAAYSGNTDFSASTSPALAHTVNKAGTSTTVSASVNPSSFKQSVTFTAKVTDATSGTPSGTVTFKDGATVLGVVALNASGIATLATTSLSVGAHSITAAYSGNTDFSASTSPALAHTVNKAGTSTTVSASVNPSSFNQSVTFTAKVTDATSGTPSGTVTFKDGATVLGVVALNASGIATLASTSLSVGAHSITAAYSGNTDFSASTSSALAHTVNKAGTSTTVSASVNPSSFQQSVTFTAKVTDATSGTPTGTVTFKDGATVLGVVALNASGIATLATTSLSAGAHSITAAYSGNTSFNASTSPALAHTVNKAGTSTTVSASVNPSSFQQSVTFTAKVTDATSGTPTGTVTFKDGATVLGVVALNASGIATLATTSLIVGAHSITAAYSGNTSFNAGTSPALAHTVNKAATSTSVAASLNPSIHGQSVTFTATVSSAFGGSPTGVVTFKDGATVLGAIAVNTTTHKAAYTTSTLAAGAHSITAAYAGDSNFGSSTSPAMSQTVNP